MRSLLIGILLAGAAVTPALAQDDNTGRWHRPEQGERQQAHQERQQARQEQQQQVRQEQQQVRQEQQQVRQEQQQVRMEQQQVRDEGRAEHFNGGGNFMRQQQAPQFVREQQQVRMQDGQRGGWDRSRFEGRGAVAPQGEVQQQTVNRGPVMIEQNREGGWTRNYGYRRGDADQQQAREWNRSGSSSWSGQRDGNWQRSGDYRQGQVVQDRYRDRSRYSGGTWSRDWRHDRRFDWRRYREGHRSIFHLGLYIDPFGYGYRSFGIGYRLPQIYFGQQYWFDPALYGLPYPPPGTQWVRYWNDALLVDIYSGQVVDVIQGFFW